MDENITKKTSGLPWRRIAWRYFVVLLALHAPSWLFAWITNSAWAEERPIFNLDLLLAAAIFALNPLLGTVALLLAWAADLVRAAANNYHFNSTLDFLDSARFVDLLNVRSFVSVSSIGAVLGLTVCIWLTLRLTRHSRALAVPLMASLFVFFGLDVVNGSFHIFGLATDHRYIQANLAGSPTWNIISAYKRSPLASGQLQPFPEAKSYRTLIDWYVAHPDGSALLVIVESMGLPKSTAMQDWLVSRVSTSRVSTRWSVSLEREPFIGATTSGELRALCGLKGHYSRLTDGDIESCLPHRLRAAGVSATGFHGFHLRMFDRRVWWPRIGLEPWSQTASQGGTLAMDCNEAFPGVCDGTVLYEAALRVDGPHRFVYALTLDTHLPFPSRPVPLDPALRKHCAVDHVPQTACDMVGRLGEVLSALEIQLASISSNPLVVVVGDHSPPFGDKKNRDEFDGGSVPVLVLMPKIGTNPAKTN